VADQRYVSRELSHFAGRTADGLEAKYETLLSILRSGVVRAAGASTERGSLGGSGLAFNPAADLLECYKVDAAYFCDIPVEDLAIHTGKYGPFGLSFLKVFLLPLGASPAFYVAKDAIASFGSPGGTLGKRFAAQVPLLHDLLAKLAYGQIRGVEMTNPDDAPPQLDRMRDLFIFVVFNVLSQIKYFDGDGADCDKENFYMEREWRVLNDVQFALSDVYRVFLPQSFAERFRADLPSYHGQLTFVEPLGRNADDGVEEVG